jgi:hypothetical protein
MGASLKGLKKDFQAKISLHNLHPGILNAILYSYRGRRMKIRLPLKKATLKLFIILTVALSRCLSCFAHIRFHWMW